MLLTKDELLEQEQIFRQRFVSACEKCKGQGYTVKEDDNGYELSQVCDCVTKVKRYVNLINWGTPKKYLYDSNEVAYLKQTSFGNDVKEYINNFDLNNIKHLFIHGPSFNTNKINSFLIKQLSKLKHHEQDRNLNIAYSLFSDILKLSFDNDKYNNLMTLLYKSDVLFIDNIGGEFGRNDNKFSQRFLENVIRKKENNCQIIVLISTHNVNSIKSLYGNEIYNFITHNIVIDAINDTEF